MASDMVSALVRPCADADRMSLCCYCPVCGTDRQRSC